MTLIRATSGGDVPLTAKETKARRAEESAWDTAAPDRAMAALRKRRNELLRDSDWTQMSDTNMPAGDRAAWQDYRRALRDLPASADLSRDIVWPTAPSE